MKNKLYFILLLIYIPLYSSASTTWRLQNEEYKVDTLSHIVIGPGTTQTSLALSGSVKLRLFYTTTDLSNPFVNLKMIMGKDNLTSNVTVPNMPASHNDPENIYFAGVNADFIGGLGPIGTTIVNKEFYKSYKGTGWYAFCIDENKKLYSGEPYTTFKLVSPNAGQASIKAINVPRSSNELILYTSRKGTTTGTSGSGVEVGAEPVSGVLSSIGTTTMRVTIAPTKDIGNMSIPQNGFVLSGNGFTADILAKMKLGETFEITPTIFINNIEKSGITEMSGGCPMLLKESKILETQGLLDHLRNREPRTAIGYNTDGTKVVLMVVDGRQPNVSVGVPSKDLAAIMLNVGCSEALNFDGGGSSTLYVKEFGVRNIPSEGSLRAVKNGLFITTPTTDDKNIETIRFADYVGQVNYNDLYAPVIYGYNARGVLIDTNITGFTLSCDSELGIIQDNGSKVLCSGNGTHALKAIFGKCIATIPVTINNGGGIDNNKVENISIYPNPINIGERAYLKVGIDSKVQIYNIDGRLLMQLICQEGNKEFALPTEKLSRGIYVVKYSNYNITKSIKLIIK